MENWLHITRYQFTCPPWGGMLQLLMLLSIREGISVLANLPLKFLHNQYGGQLTIVERWEETCSMKGS